LNKEDAMDRCKWRKMIKEARWSGWVWVGECSFWYRPTRVVQEKGPLNGCVCVCVHVWLECSVADLWDLLVFTDLLPFLMPSWHWRDSLFDLCECTMHLVFDVLHRYCRDKYMFLILCKVTKSMCTCCWILALETSLDSAMWHHWMNMLWYVLTFIFVIFV